MPAGTRRCCPACSRRWNQLIVDDCPICSGDGVLTLGRPALLKWPAEAVSKGVEVALELRATLDMEARVVDLGRARHNQGVMVARLVKAGLLANRAELPPPPVELLRPESEEETITTARLIASTTSGLEDDPSAIVRLAAPPIMYAAPKVDGARPGFSLGGYICNVAKVADPIPVLDRESNSHTVAEALGQRIGEAMFSQR